MSDPFLGEIKLMAFGFAPRGWALCNGQLLPINQNQALFSLLGTTYGGDGRVNFSLPDLRGRVPMHMGSGHPLGERAGEQAHTVTVSELPSHAHGLSATTATATTGTPGTGVMLATAIGSPAYGPPQNLVPMDPTSLASVGGSQAHQNMQPFLTVTFCIALQGIFPSHT
jgi:microcystin-dependent protein